MFASGGTGLEVKGGASAELMRTKIVGSGTGTGVVMESEGVLMLTSVDISDVKMGVSASNGKYGVQMMGEGKVVMMGGSIMGFATGVEATAGTLVMMGGTKITFKEGGTGLEVKGGASAELMRTEIKGDGTGYGVKMMGTGKVKMDGVGILQVEKGVYVEKGTVEMMGVGISGFEKGVEVTNGTVEMTSVNISGVKMGVYVGGGTVEMNMGKIEFTSGAGNGYGVGVGVSGGAVTMMGTKIVGTSGGTGVYMGSEGVLEMVKVDISGFEKGVSASNGTLEMKGGKIEFTSGAGNGKGYGWGVGTASVELMRTEIVGDGKGTGYGVIMGGGTVMMDRVWISNVAMGVEAMGTGTLKMMGGTKITFAGGDSGYGVKVGGMASATLTDVMIEGTDGTGKGTGVYVGSGTVVMDGVWIEGVGKGVEVSGKGMLVVKDGTKITFKGGEGSYGVKVGGTASATLMRTEIKGSGKGTGTGVYISGGAVMLSGVNISNVEKGVEVKSGTLKMKGDSRITVAGGTGSYGVKVGGMASAILTDVKIEGTDGTGKGTGVIMESGGKMKIDRVWIEGVGKGVEVSGSGMLEMMGNSTIIFTGGEGSYGVKVGGTASATLMRTEIVGKGTGTGVYISGGAVMLSGLNISKVEKGVEVKSGTLKMKGDSRITFAGGTGSYGVKVGGMASAILTDVKIRGTSGQGTGVYVGSGTVVMDGV
ncbi:hypothetical protein [Bartonella bovis]|uniref:Right handed beta helix domain-containing protein n=1 Tax=Bartonella bovis m02 TaxID=1094492 RepID=N6VG23_9HYPH|nr:hypothetical protein [Bartonella bovis]ENN92720.1 hypothetical protein m02_10240 [Bartonella bovis m02]